MIMKKKRLIETFEIQISTPDPGYDIGLENMLAQWGGTAYSQLSVLLVHLKFLATVHQTHHWTAKGDPFYGDHLLFERLYSTTAGEIDSVAEKAIGLGSVNNVNLNLQLQQLASMSKAYGVSSTIPVTSDLAKRSMTAEISFLRCVANMVDSLKEMGMLTRGLDNMLAGIEDTHESHVYLLKQRCSSGML